jgi:hypothetical protein
LWLQALDDFRVVVLRMRERGDVIHAIDGRSLGTG